MPDYDQPVQEFSAYFRDQNERVVTDYFESLVKQSNVDEQANIQTVNEYNALKDDESTVSKSRGRWKFLRILCIVVAGISAACLFGGLWFMLIPLAGSLVFLFTKVNKRVKGLHEEVAKLTAAKEEKLQEAWDQVAPLNVLYNWGLAQKFFQETIPDVEFEPFLSTKTLIDLQDTYGLSDAFNDYRSIIDTQSGHFKGNPFALTRYLQHWIGSKVYTGSIVIYWNEEVEDANGDSRTVQRSQVLTASVTKPFPEYGIRETLIYGHEAGDQLSFSRQPSNLSGLEDGFMNNMRKNKAMKQIEKQARTQLKKGTGDLTVMANKEFETLFRATDRDNEVQFRMLFTSLAQQEMVNILNDTTVGYGDDFTFIKEGGINFVEPSHISGLALDSNPDIFKTFDISAARSSFKQFHTGYFKALYFTFAPLFTIPLYLDKRSVPLARNASNEGEVSFWEHEAVANHIGDQAFAHPASITQNLLKTSAGKTNGGSATVTVTAHGYEGIPMVDVIPVYGNDGDWHNVPVPWTEYLPVSKDSTIVVEVISNNPAEEVPNSDTYRNGISQFMSKYNQGDEGVFLRRVLAATFLSR
jgi:hypothetical protein